MPSEAEWERAARGTLTPNPSPSGRGEQRVYPWGDEITPNYSDTNLNATSAVGAFPLGMNDYGLLDMSGNVYEWCATEWLDSYKDYLKKENNKPEGDSLRVLRGGSCGAPIVSETSRTSGTTSSVFVWWWRKSKDES